MNTLTANVTVGVLDARYRELRSWRNWYRTECRRLFEHRWDDLEEANVIALREVVRIRWIARRAARAGR